MRVALVGVGRVAREAHLPALMRAPGLELVALVDPAVSRARETAAHHALDVDVTSRLDDVLDKVDAAIIATPDTAHRAVAVACCQAGVHVLVEKPFAPTVADCEAIDAAAQQAGVAVAVGYCTAHLDTVAAAGRLMAGRAFGRPLGFVYQHGTRRGWSPDTGPVQAGAMTVSGTHFLHRLIGWFGVPEVLWYEDDARAGPAAVAQARLRCGKGRWAFEGEVRISRTHQMAGGFALRTDRGVFLHRDAGSGTLAFRPAAHPELEHAIAVRNPTVGNAWDVQLADFVRACAQGTPPLVTAAQGTQVVAILEAMHAVRRPMSDRFHPGATP